MATRKKPATKANKKTTVKVDRPTRKTAPAENGSFFDRVQKDLDKNNSFINLVLGTLIVIVLGVLLFNYFNKPETDLGEAVQTQETQQVAGDVERGNLPGSYTVKEGDTLFTIAEKYYGDGYRYNEIVEANELANANTIEVGQVITIPKLEDEQLAQADPTSAPQATPAPTIQPTQSPVSPAPETAQNTQEVAGGQGGAENQTIWGEKITGNTYTVQSGDWLSTIAGRAYGDIMAYDRIAQANNIQNPDVIEVGTVLQIPR